LSRTRQTRRAAALDPIADPFRERLRNPARRRFSLFGARFEFESNSRRLLQLVDAAFAGLPQSRLSAGAPRLHISLRLQPDATLGAVTEPPPLRFQGAAGLVCATMDRGNYVVVGPQQRSALVVVSRDMLRFPYHLRYELLEFAVYVLATRALGLIPLHAACIGRGNRALILMGRSKAGKSTVSLHWLLRGLTVLAEDSVFVRPDSLRAFAIPNFLYLQHDSLRHLDSQRDVAWIRNSPTIRRRGGIEKYQIDLRRAGRPIARPPLTIVGVVFLSRHKAGGGPLLAPVGRRKLGAALTAYQAYAAGLPGWAAFRRRLVGVRAYQLRRGRHPDQAVAALHSLLHSRRA
jgi:hypothetical protein